MRWSPVGDLLGCMIKKNQMAMFDPRVEDSVVRAQSHLGPRAQKIAWVDNETFITSGFNVSAQREYAVWDLRNLDQRICYRICQNNLQFYNEKKGSSNFRL